ncbi:xanthine dehydrogenase family protein molybdopterin-binding subunit [Roseivivax sp. CAU 1761]
MTETLQDRSTLTRRALLKSGGALFVSFAATAGIVAAPEIAAAREPHRPLDPAALDSWIAVGQDGRVTVYWGKMDMGQGTDTGIAIMAAEELDVDIDNVDIVAGDTALCVDQGGASSSSGVQRSGVAIRHAAAEARRLLLEMAAEELEVPAAELSVEGGRITAAGDAAKSVSYGELVGGGLFSHKLDWNGRLGNRLELAGTAQPKDPKDYKLVGTEIPRKDVPGKVLATMDFAHHLVVPGMLHGRMVRPPVAGAVPEAVDESSIAETGARVVWKGAFLGVVAEEEWDAIRAARDLNVTWSQPGPQLQTDTKGVHDFIRAAEIKHEEHTTDEGDLDAALEGAATLVEAEYEYPFQSHARMAPAFGLVDVRDGGATIWTDSQKPHSVRPGVADVLGLDIENVRAIWMPGPGSYGRSDADDGAIDAAVLSAEVGRPVRMQWMRNEGIAWDPKGVAAVSTGRAGIDAEGNVTGYHYGIKGFSRSNMRSRGDEAGSVLAGHLLGREPENGYAARSPEQSYAFDSMRYTEQVIDPLLKVASPLRTAHFRDPMGMEVHFGQESFIDEVAHAAGIDPVEFRLRHLTEERDRAVLELAAEKSNWQARSGPNPEAGDGPVRRGRGMAYAQRNGAVNALVAEVEVNMETGEVYVPRFILASDHGQIINRKSMRTTLEGNLIMALSRTLFEEVEFDSEMVRSEDWATYPILEMAQVPQEIDIHMIDRVEIGPRGAGEASTRIVPGAVANAIYDATGLRIRKLPLTRERMRTALATL